MEPYPRIVLKPGKEAPLRRFHPWVFSGAIRSIERGLRAGDIVELWSSGGDYLATGHFQEDSIAVKVFSFRQVQAQEEFWTARVRQAFTVRQRLGLTQGLTGNAYRLVFSEGDSLPGLVIDYYNGVCVIQTHSAGMHRLKPVLVKALEQIYGGSLKAVFDKSAETMPKANPRKDVPDPAFTQPGNGFLLGLSPPAEITETGHRFRVDFENGQKTGFFLDQRANRMLAQFYSGGCKVLNAFCYSGAFSVYALKGGASVVHSVDSSRQAIEWTREHLELNGIPRGVHEEFVADVKDFLPGGTETYDLIILDPPAFAKHHQVTHNALQAYIHINAEALKRLNPGGLLFTFSCSQAITREMFRSAVQAAAIEARRPARLVHTLSQGPDHPVDICHPEGEYLKGLVLGV